MMVMSVWRRNLTAPQLIRLIMNFNNMWPWTINSKWWISETEASDSSQTIPQNRILQNWCNSMVQSNLHSHPYIHLQVGLFFNQYICVTLMMRSIDIPLYFAIQVPRVCMVRVAGPAIFNPADSVQLSRKPDEGEWLGRLSCGISQWDLFRHTMIGLQ